METPGPVNQPDPSLVIRLKLCLEQDVRQTDLTNKRVSHTLICKLNMRSQTHQPPHQPCQHGRGEVNLTIIVELWGIIKVHRLQQLGRAVAKMSGHLAQKRERTAQDVPPPSALSFFTHQSPT